MPLANPTIMAVHRLAIPANTLPRLIDVSSRRRPADESKRLGTAIAGNSHKTTSGHLAPASEILAVGRVTHARSQLTPPMSPRTSLAVTWTPPTWMRGVIMAAGSAIRSSQRPEFFRSAGIGVSSQVVRHAARSAIIEGPVVATDSYGVLLYPPTSIVGAANLIRAPAEGHGVEISVTTTLERLVRRTAVWQALRDVRRRYEVWRWKQGGRPNPPPPLIKQAIVQAYARQFALDTLIETGTYRGDMVNACLGTFARIVSIELDRVLFQEARRRFAAYPHVSILCGDSGQVLKE